MKLLILAGLSMFAIQNATAADLTLLCNVRSVSSFGVSENIQVKYEITGDDENKIQEYVNAGGGFISSGTYILHSASRRRIRFKSDLLDEVYANRLTGRYFARYRARDGEVYKVDRGHCYDSATGHVPF